MDNVLIDLRGGDKQNGELVVSEVGEEWDVELLIFYEGDELLI